MDSLRAIFTASNTIRTDKNKKAHTIYEIEIRSSSTITWFVWRRYSQFFTLHQSLTFELVDTKVQLPKVPPKRITGSLGTAFVEKRKKELQKYLSMLLSIPEVVRSDSMMKFLDVPDVVRPMIQRNPANEKLDEEYKAGPGSFDMRNMTREERSVYDLVKQLDHHQQAKVAAIKSFEKFYFEAPPQLSTDFINVLYQGIEARGGLIETCGNFEYSNVAARAALELLCRLLDIERNQKAPLYIDSFVRQDPKLLARLNLHKHILSDRNGGAFKLASIVYEKTPQLPIEKLIADPTARRDFFRWIQRKNQAISPYTLTDGSGGVGENFMKSPAMQDIEYKSLVDSAFDEVFRISESDQGWRFVPDESGTGIQVVYKQAVGSDTVVLRVGLAVAQPADEVFRALLPVDSRADWDVKFHSGRVAQVLTDNVEIVHEVFRAFGSPYKHRDLCLLRSWRADPDGSYAIAERSVASHPDVPELKDHVRAGLGPSGFLITPYASDSTLLIWIAQLDREAVLIFSPDLLGETDELFRSFHNLRLQLADAAEHGDVLELLSSASASDDELN